MKTTWLTLALATIHLAAFAQGKVTFGNGNTHPVVIDPFSAQIIGLPSLAGMPAPQTGTGGYALANLTAQLWAGTSAGNMSLQSTVAPAGIDGFGPGILRNTSVTLTGVPAGPAFFQIYLWETASDGFYRWHGSTAVFTAPAGGFAPTPLSISAGWPEGPIVLRLVPEPSMFALVVLGVASWLLFRRRK